MSSDDAPRDAPEDGAAASPHGTRRELRKLLKRLDPAADPMFRGRPVTVDGLRDLAQEALGGDDGALKVLDAMFDQLVISELSSGGERNRLLEVDDTWHAEMALAPDLAKKVSALDERLADPDDDAAIRAEVLLALVDEETRVGIEQRAQELITSAGVVLSDGPTAELRAVNKGDETVRRIFAIRAATALSERHVRAAAGQEALDAERIAKDKAAQATLERDVARRAHRLDLVIVGATTILVASFAPASLLGAVLARSGPLHDDGAARLNTLGFPLPLLNGGFWALGSTVVLSVCAAVLAVIIALSRTHLRAHRIAFGGLAVSCALIVALLVVTPAIRSDSWRTHVATLGTAAHRGPCTHWEGAGISRRLGIAPVLVGPAPHCQLVTRLTRVSNGVRWQHWVQRVHIYRVHEGLATILVGGTFGGRRVGTTTKGGSVVIVALAPNTGKELWRRNCRAPRDGEHGIAFGALGAHHHGRSFVRLRCDHRSTIRFDAATGRRIAS